MAAGRSVVVAPVPAGRDAAVLGEGPVESVLGGVADGPGDLARWLGTLPELAGGQFHPPAGEIAVRWLADVLGEAAGQGGAGNVHGTGQVLERPVVRGAFVQQREGLRGDGVAQPAQPRCLQATAPGLVRRRVTG